MEIVASFFRQENGENPVTVILQEAFHVKRQLPVILGCVDRCDGNGTRQPTELVEFFYGRVLPAVNRKGVAAIPGLYKKMKKCVKTYRNRAFAGVLVVGANCILICCGAGRICLNNKAGYGAPDIPICFKNSAAEKQVGIQQGVLEKDAIIRLALKTAPHLAEIKLERRE